MAQGILLVGGKGTRLLPLTRSVPKPMLPLAGVPVTQHQLAMAKRAGITSIVLATSYLADVFAPYFGDGSKWGMQIQYAVEEEALGTGGAIAHAAKLLNPNEPIVVFNGDVLSSHDLSAQISAHLHRDADVTLHLTHVEDARAYGCVPIDEQGRVQGFLEKMEKPLTNTINAGCYVFHPRAIKTIKTGAVVSVEREVFPALVGDGAGVYGVIDDSYWLDIGTPQALLQGSRDLVRGIATGAQLTGSLSADREFLTLPGALVDSTSHIGGGSVIGQGARIEGNCQIDESIVSDEAIISQGARLHHCFVERATIVPADVDIFDSYIAKDGIFSLLSHKNS